jgi:hypothetical protein
VTIRRERRLAAMALGFALTAAILATDATAAGPHLSARINGHALRASGTRLQVDSFPTVFEITASTKNVRNNHAAAFACVAFDLASMPLPATLTPCNGNYQETRIGRRGASVKAWSTTAGIQVTIESFDGSHVKGTFGGAFEFSAEGRPPATIQKGKFDAVVTTIGGT